MAVDAEAKMKPWNGLDPYPSLASLELDSPETYLFKDLSAQRREAAGCHRLKTRHPLDLKPISLGPFAVSVVQTSEGEQKRRRDLLRRLDKGPPASLSVTLVAPVEARDERWAQVWRVTTAGDASHPRLLKMYDDGRYPEPNGFDNAPNDGSQQPWLPSPHAAANEAWVYEHLKTLQGSVIPRSYGFFQTELPAGYSVACHLLEELGGTPLSLWLESPRSRDERWRMAHQTYAAVHALHLRDIQHGDLACRHFFVQPNDSIRICDFGFAELAPPDPGRPPRRRFTIDIVHMYNMVEQVLGSQEERVLHCVIRTFEGQAWTQCYSDPAQALTFLKVLDSDVGISRDYEALKKDPVARRRICPPAPVTVAV